MYFLKNESISFAQAISISLTGILTVMIILALLAVLVVMLSRLIRTAEGKKKETPVPHKTANPVQVPKPETVATDEKQTAGQLDLYKTDEKTAAVIMAIVSKESGIPLNRLRFKSIKLIEQ